MRTDVLAYGNVLFVIDVLLMNTVSAAMIRAILVVPGLYAGTVVDVLILYAIIFHVSAAMVVRVAASTVPVEFVCSVQDVAQMAAKEDLASAV